MNTIIAIGIAKAVFFSLLWLGIVVYLRLKKKKSFAYLLFFTIFYVYLYYVLDYTLFRFQTLLLLQHFMPGLMVNGLSAGNSINLIPLVTLMPADIRTSLLNILLMLPFGFGLPFISNMRMKRAVVAGMATSILIELLQLLTGLLGKSTFRVADINDVIFNTLGVAIGYLLFAAFIRWYRRRGSNRKPFSNPISRHIAERPQQVHQ